MISENKGTYQAHGNRKADQRLCFRYTDSRNPFLLKSKILNFELASVTVQAGLCLTWFTITKSLGQEQPDLFHFNVKFSALKITNLLKDLVIDYLN